MKQLFLSGGGSAEDSQLLDKKFVSLIEPGQRLLYIPIAWQNDLEQCRTWITPILSQLGISDFEMWKDVENKSYEDITVFGAIYIGGGNTFSLLNDLQKTGFIELLKKFIDSGRPVYGGSAGAIILGKDIATAALGEKPDKDIVGMSDTQALDLVKNYAIHCHYVSADDQRINDFIAKTGMSVLALSEKNGVYVAGEELHVVGFEPTYLFTGSEKKVFEPSTLII